MRVKLYAYMDISAGPEFWNILLNLLRITYFLPNYDMIHERFVATKTNT